MVMQRVFVLDHQRNPLVPCHSARAQTLLKKKQAAVYRLYPFTIILRDRVGGERQDVELKVDPGSRTTGLAAVGKFQNGRVVLWGANLTHQGLKIRDALTKRRALHRGRRNRKTRYRPARFNNRRHPEGFLTPSLNG